MIKGYPRIVTIISAANLPSPHPLPSSARGYCGRVAVPSGSRQAMPLVGLVLLSAVVLLGLRIGHVVTGDTPLIVAAALVVLGGALDVYEYFLHAKAWKAILPDYEAGKTARERAERLHFLAREIVSRTTMGVWDGWEEEEWDHLTAGMDKAAVERLVLDACWDEEIREKYLTITTRPLGLPDTVDPRVAKGQ